MKQKRIAESLVRKHKTRDPFRIAEALGYIVIRTSLQGIRGFWHHTQRQHIIFIDESLPEGPARFVCAHELGQVTTEYTWIPIPISRSTDKRSKPTVSPWICSTKTKTSGSSWTTRSSWQQIIWESVWSWQSTACHPFLTIHRRHIYG